MGVGNALAFVQAAKPYVADGMLAAGLITAEEHAALLALWAEQEPPAETPR